MIVLVLSEDTAKGLTVCNEIHSLLESLKIGVCRTGDLEGLGQSDEEHLTALSTLRGSEASLELYLLQAKPAKKTA